MIYGNAIITRKEPQTYIFEDESGNQITGVYVDKETVFTATDNDVREGFVYASDKGQSVGTKNIPAYHTTEGSKYIPVGDKFAITLQTDDRYDYTKLQIIICLYNTSMANSVSAEKVCINDKVYNVGSTSELSTVVIDRDSQTINLGIVNNYDSPCVMRYFTYKEEL